MKKFLDHTGWAVVCGDGWSVIEANVICRQLGLGFAVRAFQTNIFGSARLPMAISGIKCRGDERDITDCYHDTYVDCPGYSMFYQSFHAFKFLLFKIN